MIPLDKKHLSPIEEIEFVVFDFETTGLHANGGDRVCEVAGVRLKNGKVIDKYATLVDPERLISYEASCINGITNEMVKGAPKIHDMLPEFLKFIGDSVLVAHNASFDLSFLRCMMKEFNSEPLKHYVLDTVKLSRKIYSHFPNHKLATLRRELNICIEIEHRALGDVEATAVLLNLLLNEIKTKGAKTLKDLLEFHGGIVKAQ